MSGRQVANARHFNIEGFNLRFQGPKILESGFGDENFISMAGSFQGFNRRHRS